MDMVFLQVSFLGLPPLYPTLFRWTNVKYVDYFLKFQLYIPHCSDGPYGIPIPYLSHTYFISHIVQMDPYSFLSVSSFSASLYPTLFRWTVEVRDKEISKLTALYPTLFRWTLLFATCPPLSPSFISHIVQMDRSCKYFYVFLNCSLYPTLFRWTSFLPFPY